MDEVIPAPVEPDDGQDRGATGGALPHGFLAPILQPGPYAAEEVVRRALDDFFNEPGYCLQQTRGWAGLPGGSRTAAIAASNAVNMHRDRDFPDGAFLWWTGGAKGYGHVALGVRGEARSTDAGGTGRIATRPMWWFDQNWPSLNYVGWTDNLNGYYVPGVIRKEWDEMATEQEIKDAVRVVIREEIRDAGFIKKVGDEVWRREFRATNANGTEVTKTAREFLTGVWESGKQLLKKGGE